MGKFRSAWELRCLFADIYNSFRTWRLITFFTPTEKKGEALSLLCGGKKGN